MIRRIRKTLAWSIGAVFALAVVLYVVVLAVNWRDRPPSAAALRFIELYERLPPVDDRRNAYVYLVGMEAPASEDPLESGLRRVAWMRAVTGLGVEERGQPPGDALDRAGLRPGRVEDLMSACEVSAPECAAGFADARAIVDEWTAAEPTLLPRYRELVAHTDWRDELPGDVSLPLPSYTVAIDGQRLLLLLAASHAKDDLEQVRALLASDARFWRMVLESTDLLITKAIAGAALRQHFKWGNLVLREVEPTLAATAVPAEWRAPITDSERSMVRCMTGEWLIAQTYLDHMQSPASWLDRAQARLLPLLQRQDTANRFAEHYWALSQVFEAPLDAYPAALEGAAFLAAETADGALGLYNPVGGILLSSTADFRLYAARAADIEGIRRAALAAVTLRAGVVAPDEVPAALATSELRNPYDGTPLRFDEADGTIVFSGVTPARTYIRGTLVSEREEHRFAY